MSEDPTQKLPGARPFEERVLAELGEIRSEQTATRRDIAALDARLTALDDRMTKFETRLTALEDKVDARLRETRPIWESMQQQLTEMATRMAAMEKALDEIRLQIIEVHRDSLGLRGRVARLEDRERPPAA